MGILQSIADQDAVLIVLEDDLLLQDDTSYTISGGRHLSGIKLTDVLVSVRTEIVALILVKPEVELSTVLDDRTVERGEEHMVLVIQLGYRNNQQTMVLARIAVYECRRAISARAIGPEEFTSETLLQVRHHGFF